MTPTPYLPPQAFDIWDKAQHALAFVLLGGLGLMAFPRRTLHVVTGLLVYGGFIELAQAATGWRVGDWLDWLADAIGVGAVYLGWFSGAVRRFGATVRYGTSALPVPMTDNRAIAGTGSLTMQRSFAEIEFDRRPMGTWGQACKFSKIVLGLRAEG